jgi:hypothetical protein
VFVERLFKASRRALSGITTVALVASGLIAVSSVGLPHASAVGGCETDTIGVPAAPNDRITVHVAGRLKDGTIGDNLLRLEYDNSSGDEIGSADVLFSYTPYPTPEPEDQTFVYQPVVNATNRIASIRVTLFGDAAKFESCSLSVSLHSLGPDHNSGGATLGAAVTSCLPATWRGSLAGGEAQFHRVWVEAGSTVSLAGTVTPHRSFYGVGFRVAVLRPDGSEVGHKLFNPAYGSDPVPVSWSWEYTSGPSAWLVLKIDTYAWEADAFELTVSSSAPLSTACAPPSSTPAPSVSAAFSVRPSGTRWINPDKGFRIKWKSPGQGWCFQLKFSESFSTSTFDDWVDEQYKAGCGPAGKKQFVVPAKTFSLTPSRHLWRLIATSPEGVSLRSEDSVVYFRPGVATKSVPFGSRRSLLVAGGSNVGMFLSDGKSSWGTATALVCDAHQRPYLMGARHVLYPSRAIDDRTYTYVGATSPLRSGVPGNDVKKLVPILIGEREERGSNDTDVAVVRLAPWAASQDACEKPGTVSFPAAGKKKGIEPPLPHPTDAFLYNIAGIVDPERNAFAFTGGWSTGRTGQLIGETTAGGRVAMTPGFFQGTSGAPVIINDPEFGWLLSGLANWNDKEDSWCFCLDKRLRGLRPETVTEGYVLPMSTALASLGNRYSLPGVP